MRRRRVVLLIAIAVVLSALVTVLGPGLLARVAAHRLSATLGTPVKIAWLTWNPLSGWWTVAGLRIAADAGSPALAARRITARVDLRDILQGRYRVREAITTGTWLRLRASSTGWHLPLPSSAESDARPWVWPTVDVDWIGAPRARIRLEPTPRLRSTLRLRQLELLGGSLPEGLHATVWTRGRLDRSSLAFSGKIASFTEARRIRFRLSATDLDLARVLRLTATRIADLRGAVTLHAKYDETGDRGDIRRRMTGSLSGRDVALRGEHANVFSTRAVSISRLSLDLERHRAALGAVALTAPQLWLRRAPGELVPATLVAPARGNQAEGGPTWTTTIERTTVDGGAVHVLDATDGRTVMAAAVEHAELGRVGAPEEPIRVAVQAILSTGGTVTATGSFERAAAELKMSTRVERVALPPLVALAAVPVGLESGHASGTLDLDLEKGVVEASGKLTIEDVKTISPDPTRPEDVLAFKTLRLVVQKARSAPPSATFSTVELEWPYVLIDRSADGVFPLSLLPRDSTDGNVSTRVRVGRLGVLGGRIDFRDTTRSPLYWSSLANFGLDAEGIAWPPLAVAKFRGNALIDELSPLRVEGTIGDRTRLVAEVDRLPLPPLNPYLVHVLPYTAANGLLTARTEIELERSELVVNSRVVLSRLGLRRASEEDFLASEIGIPLTLALALMKDYRGEIALSLPFTGDFTAPAFSMGGLIRQAIVRAIRGAVLSPLTAIGHVVLRDGRVERFDLDPIPFPPGEPTLDARGRDRVAQVARVLRGHPDLKLRLQGQVAPSDVEALTDALLLAVLGVDPADAPLRAYLEARLAGGPPPPLDPATTARLEALRAELPFPRDRLRNLAADRGAAAMAAFLLEHDLDPARLSATPPADPAPTRLGPEPGVAVELRPA